MHISTSDIASYRAGTLDRGGIEAVGAHVRKCEGCARLVFADPGMQRSVQSLWTPEPARRPNSIALAAAAVIALFAAAGLALWLRKEPSPEVRITPPAVPHVAPERVIRDGTLTIALDASGSPRRVSAPRPEWNDLLASAIQTGIPPAANRGDLLGAGEVLRGEGSQSFEELIEPVARVVESDRPLFRWGGRPGARYQVIVALDGSVAARSELLSEGTWTPATPLTRGKTYAWQLIVIRGESEQTVPPPDAPPARFHVLSDAETKELRDARASGSRLVTGLVASKLGLDEVAARELSAFAARHRDLAAASRLAAHYDRPAPTTTNPDQ